MKSKLAELLLGLSTLVLVLAGCGADAPQFTMDAEQVREVAAGIADFKLPEGYRPDYAANWRGAAVAAYHPDDEHSHLMFIQLPEGDGPDKLDTNKTLQQFTHDEMEDYSQVTIVEERVVTIDGQETTLIVGEGVSYDGTPYRQITARFAGKNGPALINLTEPTRRWDWARLDDLLASIR